MKASWNESVREGNLAAVQGALEADPEVLDSLDRYGQTGLMIAAHSGHLDLVQLLVRSGAKLNVTAKHGLSALMLATVAGHRNVADALARAGADTTLRGTGAPEFAGRTAADLARDRGWIDLADAWLPE